MFDNIREDIKHTLERRKASSTADAVQFLLWESQGLQALMIYRFGRWLRSIRKHSVGWVTATPLYPIYWVLSVFSRKVYGINLDQSADIAPGLCITHFGGIEVRNCCIGGHCDIHQHVKLGAKEATDKGLVINEGVYIGVHAQICADVTVGDGATIAAGAVVTQDIPSHCLVLGNPSRIVQRDYDNHVLL